MDNIIIIWGKVPGYEDYEVSNIGIVRSYKYKTVRELQQATLPGGYKFVYLSKNDKKKFFLVHRLVAMVFIENKLNKPQVNHKNGIKSDNIIHNLEWCTASENGLHSYRQGLSKTYGNRDCSWKGKLGYLNHNAKKIIQYSKNMEFIKEWGSIVDIERSLGFSKSYICSVCNGRRKTANGFVWKHST